MLLLTIALHYIAACKPMHLYSGPLCLALHCKSSDGFRPPLVVLRDKQWFQTTTVTPLVPEKHQWWSESNTVLHCTPAQTLYTSLSTLAKFKLTPCIQDACEWPIQRTECSCTCAMVHTRLQFLAIHAGFPH